MASTASDLIIVPCDSVYFYVHSSILLGASDNKFNSLLPTAAQDLSDYFGQGSILAVSETSSVMNIALHIIYGIPTIQYSPTFDVLCHAVHTLKTYGISPKEYVITSAPIYGTLLSHASEHPLDLFALASQYDLYDLALTTSSHLLNLSLPTLTDEDAVRIGPIYLKRLFFMHLGRAEALKNLLMPPPYPHTPTSVCDYGQQKQLTRAWTLAAASLAWDSRASMCDNFHKLVRSTHRRYSDVSNSTIQSALSPLGDHLLCDVCRTTLKNRIQVLIEQWSMVKVRQSRVLLFYSNCNYCINRGLFNFTTPSPFRDQNSSLTQLLL